MGGVVHTPSDFQSFCFSGPFMPKPAGAYIIPYDVRVVAEYYDKDINIEKKWDLINVSRDIDVKNFPLLLNSIASLHSQGYPVTALLVIPKSVGCGGQIGPLWRSLPESVQKSVDILNCNRPTLTEAVNNKDSHIFNIINSKTYGEKNGYLGLPRSILSKFYQSAKSFNISSYNEGQCRVLYEALCVGIPVTSYHQANHSKWLLTSENARLFSDQKTLTDSILYCIKNHSSMNLQYKGIQKQVREDYVLPLIKDSIGQFYSTQKEDFDGDLLHFDVSSKTDYPFYTRLCGHNWAPWGPSSDRTIPQADIESPSHLPKFLNHLFSDEYSRSP